MTTTQKETIQRMRLQRIGYTQIAKEVGLTVNTVKMYCYRNGLNTEALIKNAALCKNCGKVITEKSKTRPRVFCSEECKRAWWNAHRKERKNDNIVEYACTTCGKHFFDYAHSNRKFCSLACYRNRGEADAS